MTGAGITIEAGCAVMRLPGPRRAALFKELEPCSCRAPKSIATLEVAAAFRDALSDPPVRWPLHQVHGLRVALADCACRGPQPNPSSERQRLSSALGKLK